MQVTNGIMESRASLLTSTDCSLTHASNSLPVSCGSYLPQISNGHLKPTYAKPSFWFSPKNLQPSPASRAILCKWQFYHPVAPAKSLGLNSSIIYPSFNMTIKSSGSDFKAYPKINFLPRLLTLLCYKPPSPLDWIIQSPNGSSYNLACFPSLYS